jgi:hypothetical protein
MSWNSAASVYGLVMDNSIVDIEAVWKVIEWFIEEPKKTLGEKTQ